MNADSRKFHDISRIISNAEMLSIPEVSDCFFYGDCEDPDGLNDVVAEIDELQKCLPDGVSLSDLPHTFCGNKRTKIYGIATCSLTEGHQILIKDAPNRIIFDNAAMAEKLGYRPCKHCLHEAFISWKKARNM